MLEDYVKKFANLRTYKDRSVWTALTAHQAPHKPFLLLAVMDLIAQGQITENFIGKTETVTENSRPGKAAGNSSAGKTLDGHLDTS